MNETPPSAIRLTAYSHGAGCGCKIAPADLEKILDGELSTLPDPNLLVGYGSRDDAAVYDMGNGRALISTTDFFSPIVDDAFDFGRIAATNAMSDVYAMGGKPLMAVAILGWPLEKLGTALAAHVVDGARKACQEAGIPLAGGHSIDAPEPFFGLAVTGDVALANIKRNNTAQNGDVLLLTKPIGIGVLTTAAKRSQIRPEHATLARDTMLRTNRIGQALGELPGVNALTDITGFGLLGHLVEMCEGSELKARLTYNDIPIIPEALEYLRAGAYADGALRNWKSLAAKVRGADGLERMMMLCDPQTSGGLLISCNPKLIDKIMSLADEYQALIYKIGTLHNSENDLLISVE